MAGVVSGRVTWQVWSWSDGHGRWLQLGEGTRREMENSAKRKYDAARKYGITGAAFLATTEPPTRTPTALGIEVVP